jgi:hypothetical protein
MNDSVMTVVAIGLAAVLMFMFPLMSTADRSDDIAQQVVQTATTEFVDNIRSTGKITQDKYDSFTDTLAATGNAYDVDMEVQILDESANKKTSQVQSSKVGENYYYSEYNTQIENKLAETGTYTLKQGDIISVSVKNSNQTISQVLKNFMYRVSGSNTYNIAAADSGIVNVNGAY